MASTETLLSYIAKLNHPIKEIRERSLKLLIAKLRLGWELDDELSGTRNLLESLLAWLHKHEPTLQREALELLLNTIKTKTGTYIAREMGAKQILANLSSVKNRISPDAEEIFDDVVETLKFLNTVESEENLTVPHLNIPDLTSSESDGGTSSGCYHLGQNIQTSKESSVSNEDNEKRYQTQHTVTDGIRVLLFPWVDLCPSDSKTMLLIEDALRLLKSTRRCCRFIRDVFLRDFPAEIFLNRPGIIKNLIIIAEGNNGGRPSEALHVLLCITQSLRQRIKQLSSLDLIHATDKISDDHKEIEEGVHTELEQIVDGIIQTPKEDGLVALRQLPAPIYALDTLHVVLSNIARSVVLLDTDADINNLKELNISLCLVESLIELLQDCVTEKFWSADHNYKTHRDISHKSCMVMRLLGDLLMKFRDSFYHNCERSEHRTAWLRLVCCGEKLLRWCHKSPLPPSSIVLALQTAQIDPSLELFYPELTKKISEVLQNTRTAVDQEYKAKFRQLRKLCVSMDEAVKFMKNRNSCRNSKKVFECIKNSLPVLEIFQSEAYLDDIADFLLIKTKYFEMTDSDWSMVRDIALRLMANNVDWVRAKFYGLLAEMVKTILVGDEAHQRENEKCLTLVCDVGVLTEICCHGLSSKSREVEQSACDIMVYLLRGRLVLSDGCWWRVLASLLPVLPLLHVYAAHDTQLGEAICKSLEPDIAECMGVSAAELRCGLARLLFVTCVAVQLDAAHSLCRLLDDGRYLPPRESLRADVLLNALQRVQPQDFNVDFTTSPSKTSPQTTGLVQILDVLKQDIIMDEHGTEFVPRPTLHPTLEPSLRRSTLQQLSVMMRQQDLHETFQRHDGLKVVVAILRMSLMVDDYLAFPECAISCVSVLNSVCFASRYALSKIMDLPSLLIRVILVFPANDSVVQLCAQVLSLIVWAGFALQELDECRRRVPALPLSVTQRTALPFKVNSYWKSSPNAEHSYTEWLLAEEDWRTAIRVHWWCANAGCSKVLLEAPPPPAPLALRPCARDLHLLRTACPIYSSGKALLALENATSHRQVSEALNVLESYTHLLRLSSMTTEQLSALPWQHTKRFFSAPASSRDASLLVSLLHFVLAYMDNVTTDGGTMSWIKSSFIGKDAGIIALLSRFELYPQQTAQDSVEVTQVHIHIVKVLLRCIVVVEKDEDYDCSRMESLIKILLSCLERVDLRNFHMLGYLNELMRCIRYASNSRFCRLSEDTLIYCLGVTSKTLSGCASGGGRKGQACRLDALVTLLALLRQIHKDAVPVQRWSEAWSADVVSAVAKCAGGARSELRAAALHVFAALAHYAQLLPHLLQACEEQSLSQYAARIFAQRGEANIVREASASLLTTIASRTSPKSDVLELDILEQLEDNNFLDNCLDILVSFCNTTAYVQPFQPNVSLSILERRAQLEVRAQKCGDVQVSPASTALVELPPPSAALVTTLADVITNVTTFRKCPVQEWNDRGLYRLLFRCASWSIGAVGDVSRVRAATCRALVAAAAHKCVRASLAGTKDCLHNLMGTLLPIAEDDKDPDSASARAQAFLFLSSLAVDSCAADTVWTFLQEDASTSLFHLVLQFLESDEYALEYAAMSFLASIMQSLNHKENDKTKEWRKFFENLKSPFCDNETDRYCSGDGGGNGECRPDYMAEELCKALLTTYRRLSGENNDFRTGQDDRNTAVWSCVSSLLAGSERARRYASHRALANTLAAGVRSLRDALTLHGKPADVIRTTDHNPTLNTLYWLLTIATCSMLDCPPAKEGLADANIALSLNRLWPWCMMTDQLRHAIMNFLYTFTNDCPKAWGAMCVCVSGCNLVGEVCSLGAREAALQTRPRSDHLLLLALHTARHCLAHHHCRALIIKSDLIASVLKSCVRHRGARESTAAAAAAACAALARHAEGAAALLAAPLAALPPPLRTALLPALAHAAAHHRTTFLHSEWLVELLSATLLAGDAAEVVSAARAVWALAANNHKAKLQLRSAGVVSAVQSALLRMQRARSDHRTERALQLLRYTDTVLNST